MSTLDKIIFLADMTSAERSYPGVEQLRKLEMEDLDQAMVAALEMTLSFVRESGKEVDMVSVQTLEDLKHRQDQGDSAYEK